MEHIRVVVQLNPEIITCNNNFNNDNDNEVLHNSEIEEPLSPQICAEVQLIDCQTVQLILNENDATRLTTSIVDKMTFDYVSYSSEDCLKFEVSTLMDELLLQRRNCCLVRFSPHRECHLAFLHNVLITEVNKRLAQLNASINYIRVIYKDILPGGVRNMLCEPFITEQISSTRELLIWLLNKYRLKWPTCEGHDVLEFHFYILSAQQRSFKVQFSMFNVSLDRMDKDSRIQWHKYMQHINNGKQKDFAHSPLSSYLRSHVEAVESDRTLLFFNVPTDMHSTSDTVELLQMAQVVVSNRKKDNLNLMGKILLRSSFAASASRNCVDNVISNDSDTDSNSSAKTLRSKYPLTTRQRPRPVSFTIPLEQNIETHKSFRRRFVASHYSSKDFSSLSTWYRKIDEKFSNVCDLFEKHFYRVFTKQITQMCDDIKAVSMPFTGVILQQEHQLSSHLVDSVGLNDLDPSNTQFQEIFDSTSPFDFFNEISKEIECSKYNDVLKIYLETKSFELSQYVLNTKIKQLESCQDMLTSSFADVLFTLNSMVFRESENDLNN